MKEYGDKWTFKNDGYDAYNDDGYSDDTHNNITYDNNTHNEHGILVQWVCFGPTLINPNAIGVISAALMENIWKRVKTRCLLQNKLSTEV